MVKGERERKEIENIELIGNNIKISNGTNDINHDKVEKKKTD